MDKTLALIGSLTTLVAILLGTILFFVITNTRKTNTLAQNNQDFLVCVSDWANKTTERTSLLTGVNLERQNKLDILIRDFTLAGSTDPKVKARLRVTFFAHLKEYVSVSDQYKKLVKNHPIPKSPKLACTKK